MLSRSRLLYEISQVIGDAIRDIPELRSRRLDISSAYPKLGLSELEEIRDRLVKGEEFKPLKRVASEKSLEDRRSKSSLSYSEVWRLRDEGKSYGAIGKLAGISRQRVQQICRLRNGNT